MDAKQRMRGALLHQSVDRIPTQINYTTRMGAQIAALLGVAPEELPQRLDNHLLRLEVDAPRRLSADGKVSYDGWGAGWSTEQEGYYLEYAPLGEDRDLDSIAWPDPAAPDLLAGATRALAADGGAMAARISSCPTSASACSSGRGRCAGSRTSSPTPRSTRPMPANCSIESRRSRRGFCAGSSRWA